jgi:pilus assembly protein CpaC
MKTERRHTRSNGPRSNGPRSDARAQDVLVLKPRAPHRKALVAGMAGAAALVAGAIGLHLWVSATDAAQQSFSYAAPAAPIASAIASSAVAPIAAPTPLAPVASAEPVLTSAEPIHAAIFVDAPAPKLEARSADSYTIADSLKLVGFNWGGAKPVESTASKPAAVTDPFGSDTVGDAQPAAAKQGTETTAVSTASPASSASTGNAAAGNATPANSPLLPEASAATPTTPTTPATSAAAPNANDAARLVAAGLNADGKVQIAIGKQSIVKTSVKIAKLSIGNAEVADVLATSADTVLVTAKKSGATQIIVWDDTGRTETVEVLVNTDLAGLTDQMLKSLPNTPIEVAEANGAIVLRGRVQSAQQAAQAQLLAEQFGKVVNFIEIAGGQRISVKVQFAEVSRSVQNDLGINWGFSDGRNVFGSRVGGLGTSGGYAFNRGGGGIGGILTPDPTSNIVLFGRGLVGANEFSYLVNALKQNNLMRMLAQPYITTNSGEAGEIFAGGEFPVPVPSDSGGSPTIDYREFGIRLKCTPTALGNGNILMKVEYEVSDLDFSSAVNVLGVQVPGLRKRSGSQTIELAEGQTLPLGGLFDSQTVANIQKVPGLGDIPYIGALFRSTSFQRRETELVVLITPDLAGAFNPDEVPAMPGSGWRNPSDAEMAFHGDQGGDDQADAFRDQFKKPSERGARSDTKPAGDKPAVANANPTGYEAFSPLSKKASEVGTEANSTRPGAAPPLFLGEAGYAPVDNNASNTASVRE